LINIGGRWIRHLCDVVKHYWANLNDGGISHHFYRQIEHCPKCLSLVKWLFKHFHQGFICLAAVLPLTMWFNPSLIQVLIIKYLILGNGAPLDNILLSSSSVLNNAYNSLHEYYIKGQTLLSKTKFAKSSFITKRTNGII